MLGDRQLVNKRLVLMNSLLCGEAKRLTAQRVSDCNCCGCQKKLLHNPPSSIWIKPCRFCTVNVYANEGVNLTLTLNGTET